MESIPVSAERKAQLEARAKIRGTDLEQLTDEALAEWLAWDQDDLEAGVAALKEGNADYLAGRTRPAKDVLDDLAKKHGFSR